MYKNKKILALIPARGGSKGLPKKNVRPLAGKPLIAWSIQQGLKSKYVDYVAVSTDDIAIADVARRYGAEVPFIRPASLATDKSRSIDVILHALSYFRERGMYFDYLVLLEPTSPLREVEDIDRTIEMLVNNRSGAVSLVSVCQVEATHPAFDVQINKKGLLVPYIKNFKAIGRRQDLSRLFFLEGTIYLSEAEALFKKKGFYHDKTLAYVVPRWKSFEVDEIVDLVCIESVIKNIKKIKELS